MKCPHFSTTHLLNLLVFVFVVVMVFTELPPSSHRFSNKKEIDQATEIVCGRILLARQKAIAARTRYRLHYDDKTGGWTTYREVSSGLWLAEDPNDGAMPRGVSVGLVSGPSNGYIEIDAKGAIENRGAPIVIRFIDGDGAQKNIRLSPAGLVQELPSW